jgi:hypothetical protein
MCFSLYFRKNMTSYGAVKFSLSLSLLQNCESVDYDKLVFHERYIHTQHIYNTALYTYTNYVRTLTRSVNRCTHCVRSLAAGLQRTRTSAVKRLELTT